MIGLRERLAMDAMRRRASSPSAIALKQVTVMALAVVTFALCVTPVALAQGRACSQCGPGAHWVDSCSAGQDQIANSGAVVGIDMDYDCVSDINAVMWPCFSPDNLLVIDRSDPRDDSWNFPGLRWPLDGHLDVIDTEIISMCLTGSGLTLRAGAGQQHGSGVLVPSLGAIAEQPGDPTLADSFFDVFFEVELPPGFPVQFLYNQTALRVTGTIDCAPPEAKYIHPTDCIPLYTSPVPGQGMHVANLVSAVHEVNNPRWDTFWRIIELDYGHYTTGTSYWYSGVGVGEVASGAKAEKTPAAVASGFSAQGTDTFFYGGTELIAGEPYAATPTVAGFANRKMWTWSPSGFNGVPHSGLFMDGWKGWDASGVVGDYAHVKHVNDLPVPLSQDPCVAAIGSTWCEMTDSLLVFYDESNPAYPHPLYQDNYARSPIIDFSAHPGLPGRILILEKFANLPLNENVFMYWQARYRPAEPGGGWSRWVTDDYLYYGRDGAICSRWQQDISSFVPSEAEQAQIGLGVINYCDKNPWGYDCTYTNNVTPYFDNITFGIYGSDVAPYISMREPDYFQDQFAEDGTLNPTSTADTRIANYLGNLNPPIFGDTLTCRGAASDMEVWLVFRMAAVGPQQPVTHPFFTIWFPGAGGGGWQEARMDTARITDDGGTGTHLSKGHYMSTFHEADFIRITNGLAEGTEILPNNLFVPGTKIEYFLKARYAGSGSWYLLPDTSAAPPASKYESFHILPTYVSDGHGGAEWPCLIVADHFGQWGNWGERNVDRIRRHLNALGYPYDVFRKLGPTSDLRNGIGRWAANPGQIGGPGTDKYNWGPGATLNDVLAYTHILVGTGKQYDYVMYRVDGEMINSWLTIYSGADRFKFFWLNGDQAVRWLHNQVPWGRSFLNNVLGATYVHRNYALLTNDYTYCLPLNLVPGGYLSAFTMPMVVRSNGCPRTYTVLGVSGSTPNARAERQYDTQGTPRYASASNSVSIVGGANYKTLTEGYDNCTIRTDASLGYPECGNDNVLKFWIQAVLSWASYSGTSICTPGPVGIDPYTFAPPAVVTSLANAYPNPMNPTATIWYTVGAPGKVMLRVFDVSGRVIRTLVDETKVTGRYSVIWDGGNDRGEKVASGVFFYQLNAPGYSGAKKIVILQ